MTPSLLKPYDSFVLGTDLKFSCYSLKIFLDGHYSFFIVLKRAAWTFGLDNLFFVLQKKELCVSKVSLSK